MISILPFTYRLLLLLVLSTNVLAKEAKESSFTEETIVSATRSEKNLHEVLASADVIHADQIQLQKPLDLGDVFEREAGLDITRNGGAGAVTSLSTRGTNAAHTLVLIDGLRISSATLGSTQFQLIDPEMLSRVEIVRGSQSVLYGSDAIGGLIQLFTIPDDDSDHRYLTLSGGSHSMRRSAAGLRGSKAAWHYSAALSSLASAGIDRLTNDDGNNADTDAWKNKNANAYLGYDLNENTELSAVHLQAEARNEYDSAFSPDSSPYDISSVAATQVKLKSTINSIVSSSLSAGISEDKNDNRDKLIAGSLSFFNTKRETLYWQNNVLFSNALHITAGLNHTRESIDTSTRYTDENSQAVSARNDNALFLQWQGSLGKIDWQMGTRNDRNDSYGNKQSSSVALGWKPNVHHKIYASWSQGFRAPTFNDLYYPSSAYSSGNPELKPEQSDNREIGVRGFYNNWEWQANTYYNRVDDLIDWAPDSNFVWRPQNIHSAIFKGVELSTSLQLGTWWLSANTSYTQAEDAITGDSLPNRSRRKSCLSVEQHLERWQFGAILHHQGERLSSNTTLSSYNLLSMYLHYWFGEHLSLDLNVDNALDEDYQQVYGYNEDGSNFRAGIRYSW